jgi:hypothetical protein
MALVLQNNFAVFMENYKQEFDNINRFDSALPYIKAVLVNLQNFENN